VWAGTFGTVSSLDVQYHPGPGEIEAIDRLLAAAERADGRSPLSDQLRLDLRAGGGDGFAAVTARDDDETIGLAVVSAGNHSSTVELVVDPTRRDARPTIGTGLLAAALDVVRSAGGGPVHWWTFEPTDDDAALADRLGFTIGRELRQMRRPLPTGMDADLTTRPFVPGADEAAWVDVNNRAFADHPEQGGWTVDTLRLREAEPWFDPAGFLLHERDGRLAGFCWTKLHPDEDPPLGEIYVIGVDPDFQGLGLGPALTIAGLDSIARRGVGVGMLYVDAANTAAVTMYERLGFTTFRTDRAYTVTV
jgi:mycothiol synthase